MRNWLFVAWNIHTVVFLPIFVIWLFLLFWVMRCLYCFWWLKSVFPRASTQSSMLISPLPSFFFFFFFLTHTVCLHNLWNVKLYGSSLVFILSGPFSGVLLWSTLKMILNIIREVRPRYLSLWDFCIIIIIIILIWEFFVTPALADRFPLDYEWQQICSCLWDSSLYSSRSQQCTCVDCLHSSSYFQVLQSL